MEGDMSFLVLRQMQMANRSGRALVRCGGWSMNHTRCFAFKHNMGGPTASEPVARKQARCRVGHEGS